MINSSILLIFKVSLILVLSLSLAKSLSLKTTLVVSGDSSFVFSIKRIAISFVMLSSKQINKDPNPIE
ncbi:hypothetical protein [Methanobrevibacter curvatus]|uniref:hypothetical protein n=1 Tax=Methanobrevibacter curvatus TaxID=49547 RepID=UPI00147221E2|nr:hypothetical protein [Methanobrevibacter curvatus]